MFDHEKLDVYRVSLAFVAWVYACPRITVDTEKYCRGQWETFATRSEPFLGDHPWVGKMDETEINEGKALLERIVSMLTRMTE